VLRLALARLLVRYVELQPWRRCLRVHVPVMHAHLPRWMLWCAAAL
jgi:hypothetical protein